MNNATKEYKITIKNGNITFGDIFDNEYFSVNESRLSEVQASAWLAFAQAGAKAKGRNFIIDLNDSDLQSFEKLKDGFKIEDKKSVISNKGIKCMSTHSPFAYALCMGLKTEEYRTQPTKIRGFVLIQASLSKASDECFAEYGLSRLLPRGCIIGAIEILNCVEYEKGEFAYVVGEYRLFKKNFPIKGRQTIFWGAKDSKDIKIFKSASDLI